MKKILIVIIAAIMLVTSCVTTRVTNIPNNSTISSIDKNRIEILGKASASSVGGRLWILFIPLGWAKDSWIEGQAYKKALKKYPNADGLIDQIQNYNKTTVPLIVVTPQVKTIKITGTAYHIRTDKELKEYRKNKK